MSVGVAIWFLFSKQCSLRLANTFCTCKSLDGGDLLTDLPSKLRALASMWNCWCIQYEPIDVLSFFQNELSNIKLSSCTETRCCSQFYAVSYSLCNWKVETPYCLSHWSAI
ncbi:hypothetical protein VPH35_139377 [Triticum aestivum]